MNPRLLLGSPAAMRHEPPLDPPDGEAELADDALDDYAEPDEDAPLSRWEP